MTTENYVKHSSLLNLLGRVLAPFCTWEVRLFAESPWSMGVKGQGILRPIKVSLGFDA